MVTRREIFIIPEEVKKKNKKLFALISLGISCAMLALLFVPSATIEGISVGMLIQGLEYSKVLNLICSVLTILIIGRVLLAALQLALVKMEMPEKREKTLTKMSIIIFAAHIVVYIGTIIYAFAYINAQLAYYNFGTGWLKLVCLLVFFPHGIIKELINFLTIPKCDLEIVESAASSFNYKPIRNLLFKFVPAILATIVFLMALPQVSNGIYSHQDIYSIITQDENYTVGTYLSDLKFEIIIDGEEISYDQPYVRMGENYRLYTKMIEDRLADGSAKALREADIIAAARDNLEISKETFYFKSANARKTIIGYVYDANYVPGETKQGKEALNFIDAGLYEEEVVLRKTVFRIQNNTTKDRFTLDSGKTTGFDSSDIFVTQYYNDGSMKIVSIVPDNYQELNELASRRWEYKFNNPDGSKQDLTDAEKKPTMRWSDEWGTYSMQIELV